MKLLSALALSHIIVLVVLLFRGTESHEESHPNISNDITCSPPFYPVGNYCLVIEHEKTGLQSQMQKFCEDLNGTLVSIKDANMLYDIIAFIRDHDMDDVSYRIGAKVEYRNAWVWRWTSDNNIIRSGPPLWGNKRREAGTEHRCLIIKSSDFYYINAIKCDDDGSYGGICQPKDVLPEPMSVTPSMGKYSAPSNDCPFPYKMIGNYSGCYLVHLLREHTCYDAVRLCQGPNTHLAKIDDANLISAIYDQLHIEDAALWVDGKRDYNTGNWKFLDNSRVKLGTPFWAVVNEKQAPGNGHCLALTSENEYHFDDFSGVEKFGALCEYDL